MGAQRPKTGPEARLWLARELEANPPRRIFAPGREHMGDIVNLTGPLLGLRRRFPSAWIVAEVGERTLDLLKGFPAVDEIWARPTHQGAAGKLRHVLRLRRARFDLAVLLDDSNSLVLESWLGGIPLRVGIWRGAKREGLFSAYTPLTMDRHDVRDHGEAVLELLGLELGCCEPKLFPSPEQEAQGAVLARKFEHPLAAIQPGASDPRKRWPAERFGALAAGLAARGFEVAIFGGPNEGDLVREVAKQGGPGVHTLEPMDDLLALGAFLRRCDLVITNDSGPMHLNGVMGGKGLALYGPTLPSHTRPWGDVMILQEPCSCPIRHWTSCPGDCLTALTTEKVLAEALKLLGMDQ